MRLMMLNNGFKTWKSSTELRSLHSKKLQDYLLAGDAELLCFNLSSMADIGFSSFKYIDFSSFISLCPIS